MLSPCAWLSSKSTWGVSWEARLWQRTVSIQETKLSSLLHFSFYRIFLFHQTLLRAANVCEWIFLTKFIFLLQNLVVIIIIPLFPLFPFLVSSCHHLIFVLFPSVFVVFFFCHFSQFPPFFICFLLFFFSPSLPFFLYFASMWMMYLYSGGEYYNSPGIITFVGAAMSFAGVAGLEMYVQNTSLWFMDSVFGITCGLFLCGFGIKWVVVLCYLHK